MNDQESPRVTQDMITTAIMPVDYLTLPDTQITVCAITLRNGAKVLGHNCGAIDPARHSWEQGRQAAYDMAREKIWELEGYALRERLAAAPVADPADWLDRLRAERHEVAERLAKLREFMAAPKGNPTPRQLTLLAKQERAMSDYVWAMDDRIADAEAPE